MSKAVKTWSTPVQEISTNTVPCILCGKSDFKLSLKCEGFFYSKCRHCSLVQMNPQPKEEEIKKRYSEKYGTNYLEYELANEESFLNLQLLALRDAGFEGIEKELLEKVMPGVEKPRFLDIGSATGSLLACLKDRGWDCTGVEISEPQAEYARREKKLDIKSLPLHENNFPPSQFDIVHASHLIEHLNDPQSFIKEVSRILKDGGYVFIATPNIDGFQSKLFGGRWRSAIFDHLYLFSKKTLKELLIKNSFVIEKISTWGGLAAGIAPLPIKRIFDRLAKRLGFGDVMIIRAKNSKTGLITNISR